MSLESRENVELSWSTPLELSSGPFQLFFWIFLPTVAVSQPHLPSPRGAPTVIALTHCQSPVTVSVFFKLMLFPNDLNKKIIKQTHPWRIMFKTVGLQSHNLCLFCFSFRLQTQTQTQRTQQCEPLPPAEREVCESSGRWNFVPAPEIDPFSTLWSIGLLARLNTCGEWRGYWYSVSSGDPSQYEPLKSLRVFLTACLCVLPWEWQRRREGSREGWFISTAFPSIGEQTSKRAFVVRMH